MFAEQLAQYAKAIDAELKPHRDSWQLERVVAERKAFLSKKKLTYRATIKLDEAKKQVVFSELLKESGMGLTNSDSDMSPGFGFKKESYSIGKSGARSGSITEQSSLFGKQYSYSFKFEEVRKKVEELAKAGGLTFEYRI